MNIIEAFILGIVQGLTEFLPVSSSGHIEIARTLLGVQLQDNLTLTLLLHLATVCSTLLALRQEIAHLTLALFKKEHLPEKRYILLLLIACIPIALVGFLLDDQVEALFNGNIILIGVMLLITAILLTLTQITKDRKGYPIGTKSAIVMGLAQAIAVIPGLSRSGTTISAGILAGADRKQAAHFSFLMVIPPILGKSLLDAIELLQNPIALPNAEVIAAYITAFLTAFLTGYIACQWMIKLVQKAKLTYFAIYCAAIGCIAIIAQIII